MSTGTVHIHRVLRAPPERVYRAFLDAQALARGWPPFGSRGAAVAREPCQLGSPESSAQRRGLAECAAPA